MFFYLLLCNLNRKTVDVLVTGPRGKKEFIQVDELKIPAKFVVSGCTFCKLRKDFGFFCSVNHLNGSLRKHVYLNEFKRSRFVICGF